MPCNEWCDYKWTENGENFVQSRPSLLQPITNGISVLSCHIHLTHLIHVKCGIDNYICNVYHVNINVIWMNNTIFVITERNCDNNKDIHLILQTLR